MAEYIDRGETIINFCFDWDDIPPTRKEFVEFLKRQPPVDVTPAVHCKDCRLWASKDNINGRCKAERQRRYEMNVADIEELFDAISICKNPAASKAERDDAEDRACAAARSMGRSVTGNVVDVETLGRGFLKMAIIFFYWKKNYRTTCSTEEFCQILSAMGIDTFENG